MKKIISFILSAAFILSFMQSLSFFAVGIDETTLRRMLSNNALPSDESTTIQIYVNEKLAGLSCTSALGSYSIDKARKVYSLEDLMLTKYAKDKGLIGLIGDQYTIFIPAENGMIQVIPDGKGQFEFQGAITGSPGGTFIPSDDAIVNAVSQKLENVSKITLAHSFRYYTTFVIISINTGEYIIPYSTAPDRIGLKNGELYSSQDAVKAMSVIFDEKAAIENGNLNGGTPIRKHPTTVLWSMTALLAGITLFLFLFFRVRSRKT